jgi:hypothetical protein
MDTLHEDPKTFLISRSFLLRMRNIADKSCKEDKKYILRSGKFFFSKIMPFMR